VRIHSARCPRPACARARALPREECTHLDLIACGMAGDAIARHRRDMAKLSSGWGRMILRGTSSFCIVPVAASRRSSTCTGKQESPRD
jgi:hypothetical protein